MKGLKTQNLRDHMSEAELIFTALAELSTRQIAESVEATGMPENAVTGRKGGSISKNSRFRNMNIFFIIEYRYIDNNWKKLRPKI